MSGSAVLLRVNDDTWYRPAKALTDSSAGCYRAQVCQGMRRVAAQQTIDIIDAGENMAICEADPWRLQYFDGIPCPDNVDIPTEDADAWTWYPAHRWVYDKLRVAQSQGIAAAPHGVMPPAFPVFSKPIVNLRGMGIGSRVIASAQEYRATLTPGHLWMELLEGEHLSSDAAVENGRAVWWCHATGIPRPGGTFDRWVVHAEPRPELEAACAAWIRAN